jgi:hypothetical protein
MNKLPAEKRVQILSMLCEGSSVRSIARVVGVSFNTVAKLRADVGDACAECYDQTARHVAVHPAQYDEAWNFCYVGANANAPAANTDAKSGSIPRKTGDKQKGDRLH